MKFSVLKRSGKIEAFHFDKLFKSIVHSGASIEAAESIAGRVAHFLNDELDGGTVASANIRLKVIELLSKADKLAAQKYAHYKK